MEEINKLAGAFYLFEAGKVKVLLLDIEISHLTCLDGICYHKGSTLREGKTKQNRKPSMASFPSGREVWTSRSGSSYFFLENYIYPFPLLTCLDGICYYRGSTL